jgi:hypothetical protein
MSGGRGRLIDLTGQTFGLWNVVAEVRDADKGCSSALWLCRCECGAESRVYSSDLRKGRSRSCLPCARRRARRAA